MESRRLYFVAPRTVEVRTESVAEPDANELLVETVASGISPGSELLVYRGEFPDGMAVDESIDALAGTFEYPLRYGYAAVGEVSAVGRDVDPEWVGRRVFAFAPHADRFTTTPDAVVPVEDDVDAHAATLLPSVETATNLALDGRPRIGERVVVFGAGLVGLCTTHVLSSFPLDQLVVVEPMATRRELARTLGADRVVAPAEFTGVLERDGGREGDIGEGGDEHGVVAGADLVYELSGRPATLDAAIETVGYDGRVVVGSWYGSKHATVDLGGSFHRDRIDLESSQVSTIAPELRGRWDKSRRFDVAFEHLQALDTDVLLTETVPFAEAADAYRRLDDCAVDAPHVVLTY
jgi:2-desacetyl-2-hydroxyethyl bacteriochlorophyllide A dehydrogenase